MHAHRKDTFVLQSQKTVSAQQPFYILQDANYNVMALLDDTGGVVEQYQWEPYGLLAAKDTDTGGTIPHNHIGHQGLFFYRLNPQTGDTATLTTTAVGLYHNRNRWYSPSLGCFTSRDPFQSAMLTLGLQRESRSFDPMVSSFATSAMAGGGANLFAYSCGNPLRTRDPSGLFSYLEILSVTCIRSELAGQQADVGVGFLGAIRGLADLASERNMMLDQVMGLAASPDGGLAALDWALNLYEGYQKVRSAVFIGGALTIGAKFAISKASGLAARLFSKYAVKKGTKVFRVWGGGSPAFSPYWTTVDPRTVPNYRNAAGLPNKNAGRFVSEGVITDPAGITRTSGGAKALDGNKGGLDELVIPDPARQVRLTRVSGVNPEY